MNEGPMNKTIRCFVLSGLIAIGFVMASVGIESNTYAESIFEYLMPTAESSPVGLKFESKCKLGFVEINGNPIGRLDPSSRKVKEYGIPAVSMNRIIYFNRKKGWSGGRRWVRLVYLGREVLDLNFCQQGWLSGIGNRQGWRDRHPS